MKRLFFSICICLIVVNVHAQAAVEFALSALPEDLREDAQVVELSKSGENVVLKEGDNGVTCRVPMEGSFFVLRCNPVSDQVLFDRLDALVVRDGMGWFDARDLVFEEIEAGKLDAPTPGSTHYFVAGMDRESAGLVSLIFLPMVNARDIGIGVEEDVERPWMMWEGTELAHVMISGEWK